MNRMDPTEARRREKAAQQSAKLDARMLHEDVNALMRQPAMRRVLNRYFAFSGVDASPFSPNAMTQSYAIGKREGGEWWLALIRDHCPEQEVVMRNEARNAARVAAMDTEEETDDD